MKNILLLVFLFAYLFVSFRYLTVKFSSTNEKHGQFPKIRKAKREMKKLGLKLLSCTWDDPRDKDFSKLILPEMRDALKKLGIPKFRLLIQEWGESDPEDRPHFRVEAKTLRFKSNRQSSVIVFEEPFRTRKDNELPYRGKVRFSLTFALKLKAPENETDIDNILSAIYNKILDETYSEYKNIFYTTTRKILPLALYFP